LQPGTGVERLLFEGSGSACGYEAFLGWELLLSACPAHSSHPALLGHPRSPPASRCVGATLLVHPRWSKPQATKYCISGKLSSYVSQFKAANGAGRVGERAGGGQHPAPCPAGWPLGGSQCRSSSNLGLGASSSRSRFPLSLPNFVPCSARSESADGSRAGCRLAPMVSAETGWPWEKQSCVNILDKLRERAPCFLGKVVLLIHSPPSEAAWTWSPPTSPRWMQRARGSDPGPLGEREFNILMLGHVRGSKLPSQHPWTCPGVSPFPGKQLGAGCRAGAGAVPGLSRLVQEGCVSCRKLEEGNERIRGPAVGCDAARLPRRGVR